MLWLSIQNIRDNRVYLWTSGGGGLAKLLPIDTLRASQQGHFIEFIDLTEVQKDVVHCYAHRTGNEKKSMEQRQKETLIEHTELCQQYYEKIVEHKQIQVVFEQFEKLYFSEMSREGIHFFETMRDNVITFHDIGKINPRFQEKNMGNYELKGKA